MNATRVHCYAGASYPERPLAFEQEGVWLEIVEVLRQARTPEGLVFDVATLDRRYRLEWNEAQDHWAVNLIP
jgi:hypothetical protein